MKSRFFNIHSILLISCLLVAAAIFILSSPTHAQEGTPPSATLPPTNTPHPSRTPLPTLVPTLTLVPSPTLVRISIQAQLCDSCSRIRLRASPGTAGDVVEFLNSPTHLIIRGRSNDGQWLLVTVSDSSKEGWLSAQYIRLANGQPMDAATLNGLPVLGTSVAAPPTPTGSLGGLPTWLSGITAHSREIFLKGQSLGNRANVFSKVGDSITASPNFLTPIGQGKYDLGSYGSLSSVINYFSQANARAGNSFANPSLAAGGGWSAFMVLQGRKTPDTTCGVDPYLVCEYNLVKPSIALIMFGTNDSGSGDPDQFAGNLRQIVQISIDHGVIPVLSTMPPRRNNADQISRVAIFNNVIRSVAQQYDIPLWDYFAIMDNAPSGGISSDGIHPSVPPDGAPGRFTEANLQYGYTIRNLMALQVLDTLWRYVLS